MDLQIYEQEYDLCQDYLQDMVLFNVIKTLIIGIVVSINLFIEIFTQFLVKKIGYRNQSYVVRQNTMIIFVVQFVNIGFNRLISQSNFKHTPFDISHYVDDNHDEP